MRIQLGTGKTRGKVTTKDNFGGSVSLFQFFPDTLLHVGSTRKNTSSIRGELPTILDNVFTLKAINNDIAVIQCSGTIANSNGQININGIDSNATSDLKGEQKTEYEIETKTGMLINSRTTANVTGTIHIMGREVPIKIKSSVKISGKKL